MEEDFFFLNIFVLEFYLILLIVLFFRIEKSVDFLEEVIVSLFLMCQVIRDYKIRFMYKVI